MLPASQTDVTPLDTTEFSDAGHIAAKPATTRLDNRIIVGLMIALMVYTLIIGWGLLSGTIAWNRAYLLIALACAVPTICYSYGFLKVADAEQDFGLLLSAIGWALAGVALLFRHSALNTALANGTPDTGSPAALVCATLAFVCILAGAGISWHAWTRELGK